MTTNNMGTPYEDRMEWDKPGSVLWNYWWCASLHSQEYRRTDEWRLGRHNDNLSSEGSCIRATFRWQGGLVI